MSGAARGAITGAAVSPIREPFFHSFKSTPSFTCLHSFSDSFHKQLSVWAKHVDSSEPALPHRTRPRPLPVPWRPPLLPAAPAARAIDGLRSATSATHTLRYPSRRSQCCTRRDTAVKGHACRRTVRVAAGRGGVTARAAACLDPPAGLAAAAAAAASRVLPAARRRCWRCLPAAPANLPSSSAARLHPAALPLPAVTPLPTCACGRRRPERVAAPAARRLAWRLAVRLLQLHGGLLQLQLR